jgi:hypothetical protein
MGKKENDTVKPGPSEENADHREDHFAESHCLQPK